jgi:hypothetical protein
VNYGDRVTGFRLLADGVEIASTSVTYTMYAAVQSADLSASFAVQSGVVYQLETTWESGVVTLGFIGSDGLTHSGSGGISVQYSNYVLHPWLTGNVAANVSLASFDGTVVGGGPLNPLNNHQITVTVNGFNSVGAGSPHGGSASSSVPSLSGTYTSVDSALATMNARWVSAGCSRQFSWSGVYSTAEPLDGSQIARFFANGNTGWKCGATPNLTKQDSVYLHFVTSRFSALTYTSIGGTINTSINDANMAVIGNRIFAGDNGSGLMLNVSNVFERFAANFSAGLTVATNDQNWSGCVNSSASYSGTSVLGTAGISGAMTMEVRRLPSPPAPVDGVDWVLTAGTFKVLQTHLYNTSTPCRLPLSPCVIIGDPNYTSQAYWDALYAAAVLDGTMAAGKTYNSAGNGNAATTYPILVASAYVLSTYS